jgi:ABC-type branched-subunit amino acid transport system substrate-binding protein
MRSEAGPRGHGRALLPAALLASACSLGGVDHAECDTNRECSAAFGLGSVCESDGLCGAPQTHPRCTSSFPADLFSDVEKHRDTIVFGTLFDQQNETHRARQSSIQLAVKQINLEGGIDGRQLGLVFCSIEPGLGDTTETTLDGAIAAATYLTRTLEVDALLGPAGSGDVSGVFQSVRPSGTFLISPSATSPALTEIDEVMPSDERPGLLWRTAPPDSVQGQTIAADMVARGITRVAVISQSGAYGEGLRSVFQASFPQTAELRVFSNVNQLSEAITAVGSSNAEEVLFIASAQDDVVTFLNAAATNAGFSTKSIFLTDSAATQDTIERGAPALFPRIRGTRPRPLDTSDPVNSTFVASYAAEYGSDVQPFSFTSHAYDMTWMAALGASWALLREGELTGLNIAKGLRHLSESQELALIPSAWGAALQRFRNGESINIRGASGNLDYSPTTEETTGPIDVWTIDTTATPPRIIAESQSLPPPVTTPSP